MGENKYINPFSKQAEKYALELDEATISQDAIKLGALVNEIEKRIPDDNHASQAQMYYSIGTVYSDLAKFTGISNEKSFQKQLYCFRKSIDLIEDDEYLDEVYSPYIKAFKLNLYTNYANTLSSCGRKISAITQYRNALRTNPCFGMALGNLGKIYMDYGFFDFDSGHRDYLYHFSYTLLQKASRSNDPNTYLEAKEGFQKLSQYYDSEYIRKFLSRKLNIPNYTYDDMEEKLYREWALQNVLFLNTLNDLPVEKMCFANDVLHLPDMIVSINAKPVFHGMFNQIKQEYVYARYEYYCSLQTLEQPHFADKETHLINFADYPQYGIRIEQMKSAFKTLYGLFDKIAFFLNSYFDLGIHERDINFSHIWLSEFGRGNNVYKYKNSLDYKSNFALASLYWISRDFYDKFEDSPNPQLKHISIVRNALEHKYVKVTNGWLTKRMDGEVDDLALYITEDELSELTMDLLHIVREAIICLSLCVHIQEEKNRKSNEGKFVPSIPLMDYDDEWKI